MSTKLRSLALILLGAVVVVLSVQSVHAVSIEGQALPKPTMLKGKITVQFTDEVIQSRITKGFGRVSVGVASLDQVLAKVQASAAEPIFVDARKPAAGSALRDLTGYYELTIPENADQGEVIRELMQNPNVKLAEPVWLSYIDISTPNDPQYNSQYQMSPPGPDPQPYNAWDLERGSDSIKIAIIDTGVLYAHPDLAGNIWVNPGEDMDGDLAVFDPGDMNGIDDDGNGFIDDLVGWDFVASMSSVWPGEDGVTRDNNPSDHNGHGTHCAGISAAMNNNATNVTGVAGGWFGGHRSSRGCRIMCVRAGGTTAGGLGELNSNDLAAAVNYAANNGADVINASWGGGSFSSPLNTAMFNAIAAGTSFIHSAGNDNVDAEGWHDQVPGVVTVAATYNADQKWTWNATQGSNYGTWITVSAPGQNILSTVSNSYTPSTAIYTGTSMAAPYVAGLNALIRSMMPSLTRAQVDSIITVTTDNIDTQNPSYVGLLGTGRVNAFTALSNLANAKFTSNVTDANVPFTVNFTDQSPNSPSTWDWAFGDGGTSTDQNPSHNYTVPGIYDVSLKITESRGLGEEHLQNYVWARADTIKIDSVMVDPGTKAVLNIYLSNTAQVKNMILPFNMTNSEGITLDSFSVVGTRTSAFEYAALDGGDGMYTFGFDLRPTLTGTPNYMTVGNGNILKLYLNIPSTATKGAVVTIDTLSLGLGGSKKPKIAAVFADYWPVFKTGKVVVRPCLRGKILCGTGAVDLTDLSLLISYLLTGSPTADPYGGNVNAVGGIDLSDLSYLIAYLIAGGNPPPN
ncbi:MAG: S8 family serine peptidase [bacterium]|nr:S8 family serine peptidase [bacterium]